MAEPASEAAAARAASSYELSKEDGPSADQSPSSRHQSYQAVATAFVVLFCIVGVALWGLPFYYDFMVQQFGWTRAQVTSGNALSKLVVGPIFGFLAGWVVDRFGPRRMMMIGILMAGVALVGLGWTSSLGMFYFFYVCNALGYVCGGPLPNQVLLTRWFDQSRGKAMGFAYLGIGMGGQQSRGYRTLSSSISDGRPLCGFWAFRSWWFHFPWQIGRAACRERG